MSQIEIQVVVGRVNHQHEPIPAAVAKFPDTLAVSIDRELATEHCVGVSQNQRFIKKFPLLHADREPRVFGPQVLGHEDLSLFRRVEQLRHSGIAGTVVSTLGQLDA